MCLRTRIARRNPFRMMKSTIRCLLLLGAGIAVFGVVVIDDETVEKSWMAFKKEHDKSYATIDEELYRRSLFEKALQRVFLHQLAFDRGEETYTIGINKFSDVTFEEFIDDPRSTCIADRGTGESVNVTEHSNTLPLEDPPKVINWEAHGYVSNDRRDQDINGQCGGCYAFAVVSVIESAWSRAKKLAYKVPTLSEQYAIDCSQKQKYGAKCKGCSGGNPECVYKLAVERGFMLEADYKWNEDQKKLSFCKYKKSKATITVSGYKTFEYVEKTGGPSTSDTLLMQNVGIKGPTTAALCVDKQFIEYKSGIFNKKNCFTECKKGRNDNGINHTVVVIGYTKDYFIIRNSWGKKWGDNGDVKIAREIIKEQDHGTERGRLICNLGTDQSYPVI